MAFQYGPRRRNHPGLASTQVYGPQFVYSAAVGSVSVLVAVGKASVQSSAIPSVNSNSISVSQTTLVTVVAVFRYASSTLRARGTLEAGAASAHSGTSSTFFSTSVSAEASAQRDASAQSHVSSSVRTTLSHGITADVTSFVSTRHGTTSVKKVSCSLYVSTRSSSSAVCVMGAQATAIAQAKTAADASASTTRSVTASSASRAAGYTNVETARSITSSDGDRAYVTSRAIKTGISNALSADGVSLTGSCRMTPISLVSITHSAASYASSTKNGVSVCRGVVSSNSTSESAKSLTAFSYSAFSAYVQGAGSKEGLASADSASGTDITTVSSSGVVSGADCFFVPSVSSTCVKTYLVTPTFIDSEEEVYVPTVVIGDKSCARKPIRDDKTVSTEVRPTYTPVASQVRAKADGRQNVRPTVAAAGTAVRPAKTADNLVRSKKVGAVEVRPSRSVGVAPRNAKAVPSEVRPVKAAEGTSARDKKTAAGETRPTVGAPAIDVRSDSCLP